MIPLSVGCPRNDAPPTADPTASPRLASSNGERVVADGRLDAELASVLQPMLEAIVRLAERRRGHDQGHRPERGFFRSGRHRRARAEPRGAPVVVHDLRRIAQRGQPVRPQRPLRPRRPDPRRRAGPRLQAPGGGAAAPPGPPGGRAQPHVRRRMRAAAGDDAAAACRRRPDRDDARQRPPVVREPAHPSDQRAPDARQRSPRLAGAGSHLHADAGDPAARRDPRQRRAARAQVLQRCRRHARQFPAPAARADHLLPQPDGSAGPGARAARDQRALPRPHRHRPRRSTTRSSTSACRPNARSRSSTSSRRRSPTSRVMPTRPAPRCRWTTRRTATDWSSRTTASASPPPRASRATAIPGTTGSRSCANAPTASAGPSPWGGPAGPAPGSNSRFPCIRRRTRLHNDDE